MREISLLIRIFVNIKYSVALQKYEKMISPKSWLNLPVTSGPKLKPWWACSCTFLESLGARSQAYPLSIWTQTELALCWQHCKLSLLQGGSAWTFWLQGWITLQLLLLGYIKAFAQDTWLSALQIIMSNPDIHHVSWHYFAEHNWKY